MRITLKNFRCHIDATFEFPDQGLIGLAGSSGSGKSTLLKSICYGFYGKIPGKVKTPYTHGKTTSSVEIEYAGLAITRHARPKRLLVVYEGTEYEGDPAQDIIHQVLGMNYGEFLATAYVVQRNNASVLSLGSADQVKFVETLANSSSEKYKQEAKEKIKSLDREIIKIKAEMDLLTSQKEEKEGLYPNVPIVPKEIEKGINPDKVRANLGKLEATLTDHQHSLEEIRTALEKTRLEEKKKSAAESKIATLKSEIEVLRKDTECATTEEEIKNRMAFLETEIEDTKANIDYFRRYLSHLKEIEKLDVALKEHQAGVEKRIAVLRPDVVDDPTIRIMEEEVEDTEIRTKEYMAAKAIYDVETTKKEQARTELGIKFKTIKAFLRQVNDFQIKDGVDAIKTPSKMVECLKQYLEIKENELRILRQNSKLRLVCPGCTMEVVLSDDQERLEQIAEGGSYEEDIERCEDLKAAAQVSIDILKTYIQRVTELGVALNTRVVPLGEEPPDPIALHKALLRVKRIKKEYEELDVGNMPPVILRMQANVDAAAEEFAEENTPIEDVEIKISGLEEDLNTKFAELGTLNQTMADTSAKLLALSSKRTALGKLSASLPKVSGPTSRSLEDKVAKITKLFSDTSIEIQAQRKILDSVADYEHYQATLQEIAKVCEKIEGAASILESAERRLEGAYGLEEAEKEAEILALEETVSSINEHAKIYLDQMFPDPIMVRLECVKDKGKGGPRLQLNTVIDYKGDTYDDIEELSGGERQRCDIAFLLAVNDMLGSNILILDECLNELDASTNTEVLSLIRDMCGGTKMILVISHEAVRGVFDAEKPVDH